MWLANPSAQNYNAPNICICPCVVASYQPEANYSSCLPPLVLLYFGFLNMFVVSLKWKQCSDVFRYGGDVRSKEHFFFSANPDDWRRMICFFNRLICHVSPNVGRDSMFSRQSQDPQAVMGVLCFVVPGGHMLWWPAFPGRSPAPRSTARAAPPPSPASAGPGATACTPLGAAHLTVPLGPSHVYG